MVGIRPEDMEDASLVDGAPADRKMPAVVDLRETMGPEAYLHFRVKTSPIVPVRSNDESGGREQGEGGARVPDEAAFVARVSARTRASEGDSVEFVVDTTSLHFFDPATGGRITS